MWLEIANTDRNVFIDRSVFAPGTYSYRIVAKFLKTKSLPSDPTGEIQLEPSELRRSASFSLSDRTPSPTPSSLGNITEPDVKEQTPLAEPPKRKLIKKRRTQTSELNLPPTPTSVSALPIISQVRVSKELKDQQVHEGSDVRFECEFDGTTNEARVSWQVSIK